MESTREIRVLLVDDEKDFADILAKRLDVRDFNVACVYTGEEALKLIQSEEYDLVLLDVMMPGRSGLDILKEIKAYDPMIPIIMLTGHARVNTAIEGIELGAYDYLIKPVEIQVLVEKMRLAYSHKTSEIEKAQSRVTTLNRSDWGIRTRDFLFRLFGVDRPEDAGADSRPRRRDQKDE